MKRKFISRIATLIAFVVLAIIGLRLNAADATPMSLNVGDVGPRDLSNEDQTQKAIVRDYGKAWKAMNQALSENQPGALGDIWVGLAKDKLVAQINGQKAAGLTSRYIDHGHKLDALFYSAEGSALQLRDTAQVETQIMDGSKVVGSNTATVHYIVVMTPTADHWQVRVFQPVQ
jgi:hypothetical protein